MTTAVPATDPLEVYESVPAISFQESNGGYAKGVWAKLTVRDWPQLLEQRDDDGAIERWDPKNPGELGDPKLVLVVPVTDEEGTEKNLWAKKMGKKAQASIYQQLAKAQKKVRADSGDSTYRVGPGDTIAVKYVDDDRSVPPKKGNYPKMYAVTIRTGTRPATTADPLQDSQPASVTAAESEDPWSESGNSSSNEPRPGASAPQQHRASSDPFGPADAGAEDEPPF